MPEETTQAVEHENPVTAVAGQFGLNGQLFAAQLFNFLLVLIVLRITIYKPVMKLLEEREEKIKKSVDQANQIEERLTAVEKEREEIVRSARAAANEEAGRLHQAAELRSDEMIQAAKREVERVVSKGKVTLAEEKENMIRELRKEIIELSMKSAARILQNEVDEKKSKSLAEEIVRKLG